MDEMDEIVVCKYCGNETTYGELTWLNGKCMCPECYEKERKHQDYIVGCGVNDNQ